MDYEYTGTGNRWSKDSANGLEFFRSDGITSQVVGVEDNTGTLQERPIHDLSRMGGSVLAVVEGVSAATGTPHYLLQDHLGSTQEVCDHSAAVTWARDYTPYGDHYAGDSSDQRFMFTGHQWDPSSQLCATPNRYYSPAQARWTSRDPLGMVDGPNVYAYVRGNRINFTDPLGLWAGTLCRAAVAASATAICCAVGLKCTAGTVITVGALAIPCTAVVIAACASSVGARVIIAETICSGLYVDIG